MNKEVKELIEEMKEVIDNPTFFVEDYGETESMVTFEANECKTLLDYINQLETSIATKDNELLQLKEELRQLKTNIEEAIEIIDNYDCRKGWYENDTDKVIDNIKNTLLERGKE